MKRSNRGQRVPQGHLGSKSHSGSIEVKVGRNGVKRLLGVIWIKKISWGHLRSNDYPESFGVKKWVGVYWGHLRSFTRKKPCSVDRFATGICQTNFWTSRMTLTQFWNIANLNNMVRVGTGNKYLSVAALFLLKPQIYYLWLPTDWVRFTVGVLV